MGLDSVTLVVDVEKHFHISISNAEAERLRTVQDLVNCVFTKVSLNSNQECKSQTLFHRLRSFLADGLKVEAATIGREVKLREIIPTNELSAVWAQIETVFAVELPPLSQMDFDPIDKDIKIFGLKFWNKEVSDHKWIN